MSAFDTQVGGDHYKDLAIQPAEYCQRNKLGAMESFVVKYVTRHKAKNGRKDIEKAIHCLQLLLEIEYPGGEGRRDTDQQWDAAERFISDPQYVGTNDHSQGIPTTLGDAATTAIFGSNVP